MWLKGALFEVVGLKSVNGGKVTGERGGGGRRK